MRRRPTSPYPSRNEIIMAGTGTPKIALPSNEQDEIRRAKKARQKHSPRHGFRVDGFQVGLEQDKINARGLEMLDILGPVMVSGTPENTNLLQTAMTIYVDAYTLPQKRDLGDRHRLAKHQALDGLTGTLRSYANRQLDEAERLTRA